MGMLDGMTPRSAPRRSHAGRTLAVVMLVLAALLVTADRIGVAIAERTAAVTLQRAQHLDERPDVTIGGFPFLTQLATGNFDHITATVHDLTVGQGGPLQLRIKTLHVTLRHVHVARDFSSGRSEFSNADGLITYADLSQTLGVPLTYAGNGAVRASVSITVAGVTVQGSASARVALHGESLGFADAAVDGLSLPQPVLSVLNTVFAKSVSLAGLPFAIHVQQVRASAAGIQIALTARGLTYSR